MTRQNQFLTFYHMYIWCIILDCHPLASKLKGTPYISRSHACLCLSYTSCISMISHNYSLSPKRNKNRRQSIKIIFLSTLVEFNCSMSELNPTTKLEWCVSPLWGFQEMDADKHVGFPNLVNESITLWNSAYKTFNNMLHSGWIKGTLDSRTKQTQDMIRTKLTTRS